MNTLRYQSYDIKLRKFPFSKAFLLDVIFCIYCGKSVPNNNNKNKLNKKPNKRKSKRIGYVRRDIL